MKFPIGIGLDINGGSYDAREFKNFFPELFEFLKRYGLNATSVAIIGESPNPIKRPLPEIKGTRIYVTCEFHEP